MLEAMPVKKLDAGGRPIVRVLPQPIYDREALTAATPYTQIQLYTRSQGNPSLSPAIINSKTLQDTNLKQSGSLAKPYEFDLFSFTLKLTGVNAVPVSSADLESFMQKGYLEFTLGNRVYLDVPIMDMPAGNSVDGFDPALAIVHSGVAHRSNVWKFTVGKFLVHIRSTESFQITLNFPNPAFTPAANVFVQSYMNGLMYNAI
jgi:hypothetical protein